ncbi:hypothetical protein VI817_003647 [Penicillium citrinum]|nr:hypothetical protein VI817_003647 [Penicillium citrinum]
MRRQTPVKNTPLPDFVIEEGNGRIELVSGDRHPRAMKNNAHSAVSSSSPSIVIAQSRIVPSPTSQGWLEPTNPVSAPAPPTKFAPQQIPVRVPGLDFWNDDDDDDDEYMNDYTMSENDGIFGQRHRNKLNHPDESSPPKPTVTPKSDRIVVLGRMSYEDSSWLEEELPDWQHAVYVVDEPDADYTVQQNKGKESNVYLQYITDHYPNFPDYLVFLHAHRWSYHVEFPEQDNALTVQRLQLDYVKKNGYANLRCNWEPGCPAEVQPFRQLAGRTTEIAFAGAWMRIFNNTDVPEIVAVPCCAQFAVTREQILARPLSQYLAFHRWLLETELDDDTSGRVFEYLWHIIFGQDPISCPSKEQCYMDVFGLEWDPSYDLPDTSWVDESFWDNFDGDMYDFEQEHTYDNDYIDRGNRGMNEKATDDASIGDIRANDTRTDDGH